MIPQVIGVSLASSLSRFTSLRGLLMSPMSPVGLPTLGKYAIPDSLIQEEVVMFASSASRYVYWFGVSPCRSTASVVFMLAILQCAWFRCAP